MSWKLAVFGFAVMVMVCAGQILPTIDGLTITQLRIPNSGKRGTASISLTVYYETDGTDNYKSANLVAEDTAGNEGKVLEKTTTQPTSPGCFTFEDIDIISIANLPLKLILKATKADSGGVNDGLGTADVTLPEEADFPTEITVDRIGNLVENRAIRVNANLDPQVLIIDDVIGSFPCIIANAITDPPCYIMDIPYGNKIFSVCIKDIHTHTRDGEVLFCTDVKTNEVNIKETGVQTISIDHGTDNKISLDATCGQPDCTKAEMVIQKEEEILKICKLDALNKDCELPIVIGVQNTYDIFIAYTATDGIRALSYEKTAVINRNLQGVLLTADIMEVTWNFNETQVHFKIEREPFTDGKFHIADVDCTHMSALCFAYFTDLTTASYTLTLHEITKWADDVADIEVGVEQEISALIPVKEAVSKMYMGDINIEDIQVNQEVAEKDAKFCFKYNHEITNKTAQYEIILINNKGNWKRSAMKIGFDDNHDCSTAIDFPLEQLDKEAVLKMLVVARDINTGKVLSSGEKMLQISDKKVVGPEIDNSSEGYISTLAIVGAAIGGVACLMALVVAAIMFVMQRVRNDGLQYPLHRINIEDSNIIIGLDSPYPTM